MPGIAMANQEERRRSTSTSTKRRAYKEARRAVLYAAMLIAILSFSYLYLVNKTKSHGSRHSPKAQGRTQGKPEGSSDPFRSCRALYGELVGSPGTPQYHASFASSMSQVFRGPVHALLEQSMSEREGVEDQDEEDADEESGAGNILIQVDSLLRKSVLLAVWEKLSILASSSGRKQGEHGRITTQEALRLQWWANSPGVTRVCEIGFNMGHSAVAILLGASHVSLLSVEISEECWVATAEKAVRALFHDRFQLHYGDSLKILPELTRTDSLSCNLFRVDGDHKPPAPALDLRNALTALSGPSLLWMDDVGCPGWNCVEPTSTWRRAVEEGQVEQIECQVEDETHGYCVGRATGWGRAS